MVVIIMAIAQLSSIREMSVLASLTDKMYRHPLTVSNAVLEANSDIIAMHRHMKDVALARNPADLELAIGQVKETEIEVYRHFDIVMRRFLGDKSKISTARDTFSDWEAIRSEVIELTRAGKYDEAAAITKGKGATHVNILNTQMESLITFARGKADEFLQNSHQEYQTSRYVQYVLLALVILASTLIAFYVISRVHQSSRRLHENEERFRVSLVNSPVTITNNDLDLNYTWVFNPAKGIDENFIGKKDADLFYHEDAKTLTAFKKKVLETGISNRREFILNYSGGQLCLDINCEPLRSNDGKIIGLTLAATDITAHKKLEENLYKLSSAVEQNPSSIFITDPEGNIEYVNPKAEELTGLSSQEMIGHNPKMGNMPRSNFRELWKTIAKGEEWQGSFQNKRSDGSIFWVAATISAIKLPNGKIINYLALLEDISARKEMEGQVRRSQKMEAVGLLTGGIAHDFNNILSIIHGNLELLHNLVKDDDKKLKYLDVAMNGVTRGSNITRKLLAFSHNESQETVPISLNEFVDNLEGLIAKSLTASITVKTHTADDLWQVNVNTGDFEDVLLNLAINARDAMPDGGLLSIDTTNKVLDNHQFEHNTASISGDFVAISVSDTGTGIPEENKEKLFEPFFTTKETGKGTGLGLSMVYGFVQRSGGHITVYSEVGQGTTFSIYLPRSYSNAEILSAKCKDKGDKPRGSETILIIDDEKELVDIATLFLESLGYKIFSALNGKSALQILSNNPEIDLLLSDVIMPGDLDGYQLAKTAHKSYPDLKLLLTSGFIQDRRQNLSSSDKFRSKLTADTLNKPYSQYELANAVRNKLDEG